VVDPEDLASMTAVLEESGRIFGNLALTADSVASVEVTRYAPNAMLSGRSASNASIRPAAA
jgi:hypothetical protein